MVGNEVQLPSPADTPFSQASFDYRPGRDFEDHNNRRNFQEKSSSFSFRNYKHKHSTSAHDKNVGMALKNRRQRVPHHLRSRVDSEFSDDEESEIDNTISGNDGGRRRMFVNYSQQQSPVYDHSSTREDFPYSAEAETPSNQLIQNGISTEKVKMHPKTTRGMHGTCIMQLKCNTNATLKHY